MAEYTCTKCKETKDEEFFRRGSGIKSRNNRYATCKVCEYGYTPISLRKDTDMKICSKCGENKLITDFQYTNKERGYRQSSCRKCKNRQRQRKREESGNEYLRYKNGRGKDRKDARPKKNSSSRYNIKRRLAPYGITETEYNELIATQENKCGICEKSFDPDINGKSDIVIDHCHTTEVVRGLLCRQCNLGLGNLKDSVINLKRAAKYLENYK